MGIGCALPLRILDLGGFVFVIVQEFSEKNGLEPQDTQISFYM